MTRFSLFARSRGARLVVLTTVTVAFFCAPLWAELKGPTTNDRYVTRAVTVLLSQEHLSKRKLDDEISERCLTTFLKSLDPMKVYFYEEDVVGFSKRSKELDDLARKGDISFAYEVFDKFLTRVDERIKMVDELLKMEHDFTVDEEMVSDPDAATYAKNDEEARDQWRKRIKYDLLVQKIEDKTGQEAIDKLTRRYHSFSKRMHQTTSDELLEIYLTSITTGYDPHTTYMSPSTLDNFEIQMRLQLDGIGAELQSDDGYTVVKKVVPEGAADRDGRLKPEDRIIGVGQGTEGEILPVENLSLNEVVKLIRGQKGTIVRLQVVTVGQTEPQIYDVTRDSISLKDSEAQAAIFEDGEKPDGKAYKFGVIDLPSFYMDMEGARQQKADYKSTTRDVRKILDDFRSKNVDAVVVDLRRNGGGSLDEAINLTGLFIDEGPVVQVKGSDGEVRKHLDETRGTSWNGPLVVLTSKFSASASEIFAGAIQDYGRGLIVGDTATHGKGTVQSLLNLGQQFFTGQDSPNLGALKLTMQQFYRPNGDSTQNRGVLADVELPSLTSHLDVGESDLDYAVAFDHVDPARYRKLGQVNEALVEQLKGLTAQRQEKSEDFQKVSKDIARYLEQKSRKTITLNEEKFMAERDKMDAQKAEEKKIEELVSPTEKGIKRDYYLNEALTITEDYLELAHTAREQGRLGGTP